MAGARDFFDRTFRSLRIRNFRLYFVGQAISAAGLWMQSVAQMWLVLEITGSGTALGVTTALQSLPVLVAGAWGGALSDRIDKRRLLLVTQFAKGVVAGILGGVVAAGIVELWMVYALALAHGALNAIDNPARRSFVSEMAGEADVANAISLNSALLTSARMVGPSIAGVLIATVGTAACFFINGASFVAVIIALWMMRVDELHRAELVRRAKGQVRDGFRYAMTTADIRLPLLMMAVIGTLAYNFRVILPLLAESTFNGGPGLFGLLYSVMSIGSLGGALFTASRVESTSRYMVTAALAFGLVILAASAAPTLPLEFVALIGVGAASAAFTSATQATLQLRSDPMMRGRVNALYSVVFMGSTPIGGPIVGWIAENYGPRMGFGIGGVAAVLTGLVAIRHITRRPTASAEAEVAA